MPPHSVWQMKTAVPNTLGVVNPKSFADNYDNPLPAKDCMDHTNNLLSLVQVVSSVKLQLLNWWHLSSEMRVVFCIFEQKH